MRRLVLFSLVVVLPGTIASARRRGPDQVDIVRAQLEQTRAKWFRRRLRGGVRLIGGNLSKVQVNKVLERTADDALACQARELAAIPWLGGGAIVRFTITAEGTTTRPRVLVTDIGNQRLLDCLLALVGELRFPKPEGGWTVEVEYPFVLPRQRLADDELLHRVYALQGRRRVEACVRRALADPQQAIDLPGGFVAAVTIGDDGVVTAATIERSTLNSPTSEKCIVEAIRRTSFPNPFGHTVQTVVSASYYEGGKPDLDSGGFVVWGKLSKARARRRIIQGTRQIRRCVRQETDARVRVLVQLSIDRAGRVPAAVIRSTTPSSTGARTCIVAALKKWRFPRPPGGMAIVTYPFDFPASSAH